MNKYLFNSCHTAATWGPGHEPIPTGGPRGPPLGRGSCPVGPQHRRFPVGLRLGRGYTSPQIGFEGCFGDVLGPNLVTNRFSSGYLGPAGKRPERAKVTTYRPIGNQILAQKAPETPLKPYLGACRAGSSSFCRFPTALPRSSSLSAGLSIGFRVCALVGCPCAHRLPSGYLRAIWPDFSGFVFEVWSAPVAWESLQICGGRRPPPF